MDNPYVMIRRTKFEVSQAGEIPAVVLSISGELDIRTVSVVLEHVDEQLGAGASDVTLDLRPARLPGLVRATAVDRAARPFPPVGLAAEAHLPQEDAATLVLRATGEHSALPFAEGPAS